MKTYRPLEQLFVLLLAFIFSVGLAPKATLVAQTPDHSNATPAQDMASKDAAFACDNLFTLTVNNTLEQSMLQGSAAAVWIKFTVQQDARYRLEVRNAVGLHLALHDRCIPDAPSVQLHDGQLEFTANRAGDYYLLVKQDTTYSTDPTGYQVTLMPATPYRPNAASLAAVPTDLLRRATEFLEEMRSSELAPEWRDARINPEARIFYRPDIQVAAYYEFTVEKPVTTTWKPAGFMELSTGEHDYIVTSWDTSGASPTAELEEIKPLGATLTQIYKLDSGSHAAEYEELTSLGISTAANNPINVGDLPGRIEGLNSLPEEPFPLVTEILDSSSNYTREGPEEMPLISQDDWSSWTALKDGYATEYSSLLKSLEQRASYSWWLENGIKVNGESLIKGDVRTVYRLAGQTISSIGVTGAGADPRYLKQELLGDAVSPTGIKLTVLHEPADKQIRLPIEVALQYATGVSETVKFAIVNAEALGPNTIYVPLVSKGITSASVNTATPHQFAAPSGVSGNWYYWWAYGNPPSLDISSYGQFDYKGCASGCGATAWAMVFGWVDRRAAFDHYPFAYQDGIYRTNGGLPPAEPGEVAPLNQDAGVQNMTAEIRDHIGTWCIFGSGATWPWNMIDASKYVKPRATVAWRMQTNYDPTGLCWFGACNGARNLAIDAVANRHQPAVIGTGWLKHYPVAYGYAEYRHRDCFLWWCWDDTDKWFYVNNGWYGKNNGWVKADSWFGGAFYPN